MFVYPHSVHGAAASDTCIILTLRDLNAMSLLGALITQNPSQLPYDFEMKLILNWLKREAEFRLDTRNFRYSASLNTKELVFVFDSSTNRRIA